jgi:transcription elongation factor Elf1
MSEKYHISMLGQYLEKFKKKTENSWTFRCPSCGDSQKNKNKTRGYIFHDSKNDGYVVKCHNCGYFSDLKNFIREFTDNSFYRNYISDRYRAKSSSSYLIKDTPIVKEIESIDLFDTFCRASESKDCISFLKKRKIPSEVWDTLYYTHNTKKLFDVFPNQLEEEFKEKIDCARLIIPFYKPCGELFAIQARSLNNFSMRYITFKIDSEYPLIYNLNKYDRNNLVFVTEGPIDSMFLPNAIAVAGSDFARICDFVDKENSIIILDNEPRNYEIIKKYEKFITMGYKVFIWNSKIKEKDINDLILTECSSNVIVDFIKKNSWCSHRAKLELTKWRKV